MVKAARRFILIARNAAFFVLSTKKDDLKKQTEICFTKDSGQRILGRHNLQSFETDPNSLSFADWLDDNIRYSDA